MAEIKSKDGLYKISVSSKRKPVHHIQESSGFFLSSAQSNEHRRQDIISMAIEWHRRLGNPIAERMARIAQIIDSIPQFSRDILKNIIFPACSIIKPRRYPVKTVPKITIKTLEPVQIYVLGPTRKD